MSEKVTITVDDMKELITSAVTAAVQAAKQPSVVEQAELDRHQREVEARQEERLANAVIQKQQIAEKQSFQSICSHKHSQLEGGQSHCVYIANGDYIICQNCQKITRRSEPELFNRLFQECAR